MSGHFIKTLTLNLLYLLNYLTLLLQTIFNLMDFQDQDIYKH
jgi:hypothetical protein